jgi:voltage-gated sodium channel
LVALLLVNLVFALGATQLFGRAAPQFFGNPALSIYSIFRVFTLEGWNDIPDAIAANSSWMLAIVARIYFVVAVTIGGLLGLSLANAVFVDEMTMDNTDELEAKIDLLIGKVDALEAELKARR